MALFEEIEATRDQTLVETMSTIPSTSMIKGRRELKKLDWSIKYESSGNILIEGEEGKGALLVFMKPAIVTWNVRVVNALNKRFRIKGLLKEWKADLVCLLETNMEIITWVVVRSLWGCQHVDWCYMGASGASGGILLMWVWWIMGKIQECVGKIDSCVFFTQYR
jgi:hypothetical protein